MLSSASQETEVRMRELQGATIGDRRVRLLAGQDGRYTVTIEVRGPRGAWEDSSFVADRDLARHTASLCYRLRLTEQEARAIAWGETERPPHWRRHAATGAISVSRLGRNGRSLHSTLKSQGRAEKRPW